MVITDGSDDLLILVSKSCSWIQVTQTMQIPLAFAEDIIGIGGGNIAYIRRASGAVLTVQETGGLRDEITVEIKGTTTQVQTAQQLIQVHSGLFDISIPIFL